MLESVLDALPAELMMLAPRPSHLQMVDYHAGVLRCAAADELEVLTRVAEVVEVLHSVEAQPEEMVPVHGDFYEGQLLADDGRVTAVLDIDTAGPGERSDEWATLLAHLSALALEPPGGKRPPVTQTRSWPTPSGGFRLNSYDCGPLRRCSGWRLCRFGCRSTSGRSTPSPGLILR